MNNSFLTKLANASTEVLTKGKGGTRTSSHPGDAYINKSGRLFGTTTKHNLYFDIELGNEDGTDFIKIKDAVPTIKKDKKTGKDIKTYGKNAFKSSAPSTGTAFIVVTKLCNKLFGGSADTVDWGVIELKNEGEQDGWTYYTVMDIVFDDEADTEDTKKADASKAKAKDAKTSKNTK